MPQAEQSVIADARAVAPGGGVDPAVLDARLGPYRDDPSARAAMERILARTPKADPVSVLPDVHPARLPRHIAIIMDGNGRWAKERGFARVFGHRNGAASVRRIIEASGEVGIEALTLYSFSLENWRRPDDEVRFLMDMYAMYLDAELHKLMRENMRFVQIGRLEGLPPEAREASERVMDATKDNTGATLCLAVNYGSRSEITEAARALAREAAAGTLDPETIDEAALERRLDTHAMPDPDLLIRTAGEMRVSNFLLWQISYAELHVTRTYWPDFDEAHFHNAIRDFARRERRFGGLGGGGGGSPESANGTQTS